MSNPSLEVDRSVLIEGLRSLARLTSAARAGQAILRFEDGRLSVVIGGGEALVTARGDWPGEGRVLGSMMLALGKNAPAEDPLTLTVEGGNLRIGRHFTVKCAWQAPGSATVQLPLEASLLDVLRVIIDQSDEALRHSGILKQAKDARARRDRLVEQAARVLAPLRIDSKDSRRLVDDRIRSLNAHS